jgi:hypothetical protein
MVEKHSRFTRTPQRRLMQEPCENKCLPLSRGFGTPFVVHSSAHLFAGNIPSGHTCWTLTVPVPVWQSSLTATSTPAGRNETRFLNSRGIRVIRFCNRGVWNNLDVKEIIALELMRLEA